jgi:hypothetical protein
VETGAGVIINAYEPSHFAAASKVVDVRVDGVSVMARRPFYADTDAGVVRCDKDEHGKRHIENPTARFECETRFVVFEVRGVVEVDFPEGVSWPP